MKTKKVIVPRRKQPRFFIRLKGDTEKCNIITMHGDKFANINTPVAGVIYFIVPNL